MSQKEEKISIPAAEEAGKETAPDAEKAREEGTEELRETEKPEEAEEAPKDRDAGMDGKIQEAMAKIVADTVGEEQEEGKQGKEKEITLIPMAPKPMPKGTPNLQKKKQEAPGAPSKPGGGSHKGLKAAGIAAAMLAVAAGCAYGAAGYYYSDKFFEGTSINGIDCGGLTVAQVEEKIAGRLEDYSIQVMARDQKPQEIDGEDIDYQYVPDGSVQKLLKDQNPMAWVTGYFGESKYEASSNIAYSKTGLKAQLTQLECAKPENQVAPKDAYVAFGEGQFEIVPETKGTVLDTRKAFAMLDEAVSESAQELNLDMDENYLPAAVTKDDPALAATLESCNAYAKTSVTYTFGEETVVLDGNTIKDWLTFDENNRFIPDDAALSRHVAEYVANLAATYDTVGKERNFHTTSGRDIVVGGGNYGWQIDQAEETAALLELIKAGQVVTREPVYEVTGLKAGRDDIGDTYIEVDLSAQTLYFYRNGELLLQSPFVSGNMSYSDRVTPTGVCHLYYKQTDQVLRGKKLPDGKYEYEQPVKYWMPFNGGVGFHDANWRWEFGGNIYQTSGSHGCINMPPENAAVLYDLIDTTIPIVVFY